MICILPPNSTPLERNLATAGAEIEHCDTNVIVDVTRSADAPVEFLPYLAWEVSVDRWSEDWSAETKRKVIEESFFVHKRKGTIASLRRVVEPFGYLLQVREWWQEQPAGRRGTFRLDIGVNEFGITEDVYAELERLIDDAKPLSRHMVGLSIVLLSHGNIHFGLATLLGEVTTVYPPSSEDIVVNSLPGYQAATHLIETVTVSSL